MLKKIEPRIVVPLVLGMMFALGDEVISCKLKARYA